MVYELYEIQNSLCFFDEAYIRAYDAEITKIKSCATIGEAMALAPSIRLSWIPGIPGDEHEMVEQELKAEDAYCPAHSLAAQQGDWPKMPTALSLRVFDRDDAEAWGLIFSPEVRGQMAATWLNGDYLEICPDREAALLAAFDKLGIQYERDDAIVENVGMP